MTESSTPQYFFSKRHYWQDRNIEVLPTFQVSTSASSGSYAALPYTICIVILLLTHSSNLILIENLSMCPQALRASPRPTKGWIFSGMVLGSSHHASFFYLTPPGGRVQGQANLPSANKWVWISHSRHSCTGCIIPTTVWYIRCNTA